jgi:hypothetical protein
MWTLALAACSAGLELGRPASAKRDSRNQHWNRNARKRATHKLRQSRNPLQSLATRSPDWRLTPDLQLNSSRTPCTEPFFPAPEAASESLWTCECTVNHRRIAAYSSVDFAGASCAEIFRRTFKMSHDRGGHDSCLDSVLGPLLHFGKT